MIVVDDAVLLTVLAGTADADVRIALDEAELFTTGSWYWRLSRALHDRTSQGVLSRAMAGLAAAQQSRVTASVERLPDEVGLLSLRDLVPVMTTLDAGRRLNLLTSEALAVAVILEAAIVVTTDSPLLTEACEALGVEVRRLSL